MHQPVINVPPGYFMCILFENSYILYMHFQIYDLTCYWMTTNRFPNLGSKLEDDIENAFEMTDIDLIPSVEDGDADDMVRRDIGVKDNGEKERVTLRKGLRNVIYAVNSSYHRTSNCVLLGDTNRYGKIMELSRQDGKVQFCIQLYEQHNIDYESGLHSSSALLTDTTVLRFADIISEPIVSCEENNILWFLGGVSSGQQFEWLPEHIQHVRYSSNTAAIEG